MKCAVFAMMLLTTASALAQEKPAKEPAALVQARETYEAKVKAAVDPITTAYLKQLDAMKKACGAKGDLVSALAVQKEIESLTTTRKPKSKITIVGKWTWGDGSDPVKCEFLANGRFTRSDRPYTGQPVGNWLCLDKEARKYEVRWLHPDIKGGGRIPVDTLILTPDGMGCEGVNNFGDHWHGTRVEK